jgi:hypothetical protein
VLRNLKIRVETDVAPPNTAVVAKDYAVGLLGGLVLALAVAILYVATEPKEETGLVWGDKVYTSKQEFNGYLKSKGLSYKIWLARNPGVAPWEANFERRAAAAESGSRSPLVPAALGLLLGTGCTLLEFRRRRGRIPGRIGGFLSERFDAAVRVDVDAGPAGVQRVGSDTVAFGVIAALTTAMFLLFVVVLAAL